MVEFISSLLVVRHLLLGFLGIILVLAVKHIAGRRYRAVKVHPSEDRVSQSHKKLGDLLLERKLISADDLETALSWQEKVKRPLGSLLVRMGLINERELTEVLSEQLKLPIEKLNLARAGAGTRNMLPRPLAVRYSAFPVRMLENGGILLAIANRPKPQHLLELETALGKKICLCLTTRSELGWAMRLAYGITPDAIPAVTIRPTRGKTVVAGLYRRLGDILLDQGIITPAALEAAVEQYSSSEPRPFGQYLVDQALITSEQLKLALELQATENTTEDATTSCTPTAASK